MAFAIPKNKSNFLFAVLNSSFLRSSMTTSSVIVATRNRQKTNANGSIYVKPILIIGNDVPHRMPASMVRKIALLFLVNNGFDNRSSPCSVSSLASVVIKAIQ